MKRSHLPMLSGVCSLLAVVFLGDAAARGGTLYQTGFEAPTFEAGQPVDGQEDWVATIGSGAGIITINAPAGGLQSLQVDGNALEFFDPDGLYEGVYNPITQFNAGGASQIWLQADVRLDGPGTTEDLISANLFVANTSDVLAQSFVSSDGQFYGVTTEDSGQFASASLGAYHRLGLLLDLVNLQGYYYLDGQLVGTLAIPSSVLSEAEFVVGVALFAAEDSDGFSRSNYTGYFDNLTLAAVPEPTSALLILLGIPVLVCAAGSRGRKRGPGLLK